MKYIVGLGNPGQKYMNNRHNAGHMFIDFLNNKNITSVKGMKTDCFMNVSGVFVKKQVNSQNISLTDLFIAHDDLDIPLGSFKIQLGRGPKIHNGIDSVEQELGSEAFWRIRIGIDTRTAAGGARPSGEEYVLSDFTADELKTLAETFSQVAIRLKTV
ncbi:aminoacyl-tRNA hydrolase [Candidatus Microgenomates bacterium]|nr:aminoacyl-tRNA hydrolase [Candidatus Microgenomates bacterium]